MRTKIKDILKNETGRLKVNVKGWVRSFRNNQSLPLMMVLAWAIYKWLLVLIPDEAIIKKINNGGVCQCGWNSDRIYGQGAKGEVKADSITVLGECEPEQFPLQLKNRPSLEYLREIAHLRFRTNTFGAVVPGAPHTGICVHKFFNDRGFVYLHTPIVTASDAEGP